MVPRSWQSQTRPVPYTLKLGDLSFDPRFGAKSMLCNHHRFGETWSLESPPNSKGEIWQKLAFVQGHWNETLSGWPNYHPSTCHRKVKTSHIGKKCLQGSDKGLNGEMPSLPCSPDSNRIQLFIWWKIKFAFNLHFPGQWGSAGCSPAETRSRIL